MLKSPECYNKCPDMSLQDFFLHFFSHKKGVALCIYVVPSDIWHLLMRGCRGNTDRCLHPLPPHTPTPGPTPAPIMTPPHSCTRSWPKIEDKILYLTESGVGVSHTLKIVVKRIHKKSDVSITHISSKNRDHNTPCKTWLGSQLFSLVWLSPTWMNGGYWYAREIETCW